MKNYTLASKIKRLYFIGFLVVILICIILFAFISAKLYQKQSYKFCENALILNINLIDNKLLEIQECQRIITQDPKIIEIVEYRKNNDVDYSVELYNQRTIMERFQLLLRSSLIENAYIVDRNGECYYSFKSTVKSGELNKQEWFNQIVDISNMSISYISKVHDKSYLYNKSDKQVISMVMPINVLGDYPSAYFVCDIDLEMILGNNPSDINFALIDYDNGWYLLKNDENGQNTADYNVGTLENNQKIEEMMSSSKYQKYNTLTLSMKSKIFGLEIVGIKILNEIKQINIQLVIIFLIVVIIAIMLTFIISDRVAKIIVNPMNRLIDKCKLVATGNYNVEFTDEQNYEILVLSNAIKSMIDNITFLNNKIVKEEKKFSKEKLKALQHQINPHFINNVLQSIKSLAISGDTKKISNLSTLLGKIMSYSVYRPYHSVTINDELEHIKNYMDIQNIRFDNNIIYFIECDEKLLNQKILKLTLQPILENSIEHGIKSLEKGVISVSVEEEKDSICIIINDNGKGVSNEKLLSLKQKLKLGQVYTQEKSIGILNVNERIKKKYGNEYGLELVSKENVGTTVIVKLPKNYN